MTLTLHIAKPQDARKISEIHMAAFANNGMLLAQFPTPAIRRGLQNSIEEKALADIHDAKTEVLIVRDITGETVAFAKWGFPVSRADDYVEPAWVWPEGTRYEILDIWTEIVEKAQHRLLGDKPCLRLNFLATHPDHERKGAASLLVQWGLVQYKLEPRFPIYLESTVEAGALYEKHGFKDALHISMDVSGGEEKGGLGVYEEICYVYPAC